MKISSKLNKQEMKLLIDYVCVRMVEDLSEDEVMLLKRQLSRVDNPTNQLDIMLQKYPKIKFYINEFKELYYGK